METIYQYHVTSNANSMAIPSHLMPVFRYHKTSMDHVNGEWIFNLYMVLLEDLFSIDVCAMCILSMIVC